MCVWYDFISHIKNKETFMAAMSIIETFRNQVKNGRQIITIGRCPIFYPLPVKFDGMNFVTGDKFGG